MGEGLGCRWTDSVLSITRHEAREGAEKQGMDDEDPPSCEPTKVIGMTTENAFIEVRARLIVKGDHLSLLS